MLDSTLLLLILLPLDFAFAMAVRWGILGCAGIAEKFCASVSRVDAAEVAAVGSRSLEKAEQFIADNCPGAKAYGSYQDS